MPKEDAGREHITKNHHFEALRQNSPFAGVLSEEERQRVLSAFTTGRRGSRARGS
jgi:hypothetical protein